MANSKYEYVRSFEQPDILLANTWIVVRIDGRGFTKFTAKYKFAKPNDRRALDLMNAAAEAVMKELPDLCLAYGNSDEFSFVFHKNCSLFERRASKLTSTIVSTFTAYYTFLWPKYFPNNALTPPLPSFDGRAVCYPSDRNLRDYMSWRQVDCHINNLYNTTFWTLVLKGGMEQRAAEQELSGTVSADKNEILFSRFGINYNNEPEIFRKGSVLYRDFFPTSTQSSPIPARSKESVIPISHPQPRRSTARPMSQPVGPTHLDLTRHSPLNPDSEDRGPTFLSTSTTPSPPPSPPSMSIPIFPLPRTFSPVSAPANGASKLPHLTPLPLPPPTLRPSTKPPPCLNPPNPTAHINTSPQASPIPLGSIPSRTTPSPARRASHSASTSFSSSLVRPTTTTSSSGRPVLKYRSPSLSILETQPPIIPLRISSIPANSKPRKLSLASLKTDEKDNGSGSGKGSKSSPPLLTMKELPSPPLSSEQKDHGENSAADTTQNTTKPSDAVPRQEPTTSSPPPKSQAEKVQQAITKSTRATSSSNSKVAKSKVAEPGGWAAATKNDEDTGMPREMSRTQREKERKKRTKARIVIEHVDVIRDEFWEKRPWILSGRAGH